MDNGNEMQMVAIGLVALGIVGCCIFSVLLLQNPSQRRTRLPAIVVIGTICALLGHFFGENIWAYTNVVDVFLYVVNLGIVVSMLGECLI
jgi:hypothetical protein